MTNPLVVTKLTVVLMNVSFPIAVFISLLSWCIGIAVDEGGLGTFKNHFFHTVNTATCLLYLVCDPETWSFAHCYQPLLYGLAYVAFAGSLQAAGIRQNPK